MSRKSDIEKTASPSDKNHVYIGLLLFVITIWLSVVYFGPKLYNWYESNNNKTETKNEIKTPITIPEGSDIQFTQPNGDVVEGKVLGINPINEIQVKVTLDNGNSYIIPMNDIFVTIKK